MLIFDVNLLWCDHQGKQLRGVAESGREVMCAKKTSGFKLRISPLLPSIEASKAALKAWMGHHSTLQSVRDH